MREILFRGKRKDNGEFVYGNLFIPDKPDTPTQICIGTNVVRITYDVVPETVGQYTGLTDKNGKKIFEGDILKFIDSDCEGIYLKVVFKDCAFLLDDNGIIPENLLPSYSWLGLEVIGNIHDNPDLLEVGI